MSEEDDLLTELLSIATKELDSLNKKSNPIKEADIFKQETNLLTKEVNGNNFNSVVHKGDTDSSEDEENRANEKKYNKFGSEINHLLQATPSSSYYKQQKSSWKTKASLTPTKTLVSRFSEVPNQSSKPQDVFTDPIFGMRIVNPLISSTTLKERMVGREAVPFAKLNRYLLMCDKDKDWVIAGVIANKSAVKTSQKGSQYCIWTLTDLKNDIKTASLFLFSKAYKELWKTIVGTVVGVLNPNVLDKRDGSKDEACLSVDNPQKVLIFGTSKDFGTCKSTKRNGEPCNSIVNINQCEYCIYHIKQEYQKCSKRSELQANFAGRGLTALRNKVLGKNEVFYAGKSYMAIPAKKSRKLEVKDNNRLQSLSGKSESPISSDINRGINKNVSRKMNAARLDISHAQKLRDLELLKKLEGGSSQLEIKGSFSGKHSINVSLEDSKKLALDVIDKIKSKGSANNSFTIKDNDFFNESDTSKEVDFFQTVLNRNDILRYNKNTDENVEYLKEDYSTANIIEPDKPQTLSSKFDLYKKVPAISGPHVYFNKSIAVTQKDIDKLKAIEIVKKYGGIKKTDPNDTKGHGNKRPLEDAPKAECTPKKSKLTRDEFRSDRYKKMMEATSRHLDLLDGRDDEEREKYFNKLEMKEKMEEKMINTHKVKCKAVRCLRCRYTSYSASDLCKKERHPVRVFDAIKRFFGCENCGSRTTTFKILPAEACKRCGCRKWKKSGMKKNDTFVIHSLSIRGGEQTFVNSAATNANINLLVPDDA